MDPVGVLLEPGEITEHLLSQLGCLGSPFFPFGLFEVFRTPLALSDPPQIEQSRLIESHGRRGRLGKVVAHLTEFLQGSIELAVFLIVLADQNPRLSFKRTKSTLLQQAGIGAQGLFGIPAHIEQAAGAETRPVLHLDGRLLLEHPGEGFQRFVVARFVFQGAARLPQAQPQLGAQLGIREGIQRGSILLDGLDVVLCAEGYLPQAQPRAGGHIPPASFEESSVNRLRKIVEILGFVAERPPVQSSIEKFTLGEILLQVAEGLHRAQIVPLPVKSPSHEEHGVVDQVALFVFFENSGGFLSRLLVERFGQTAAPHLFALEHPPLGKRLLFLLGTRFFRLTERLLGVVKGIEIDAGGIGQ